MFWHVKYCITLLCRVWSPRKKATNSTTTWSKVPASKASRASSIKPTWAPPRSWPRWSAIVAPPSPWPLPPAILACPPPCGRPPSKPESGTCWLLFGPGHAPDPLPLTTCCWPPCTASASPGLKPKWPSGIAVPSCRRCGSFPPSALLRKHSGMLLNRSCRKAKRRSLRLMIPWSKLSCACWDYGKRNNW